MLPSGYMTDRQLEMWGLLLKGLSKAEVGRTLGVTRQAVYDAGLIMIEKVEQALMHTAESNMVETQYIDISKGVLLGYSPATKNKVIITFSPRNGVQTWHYQQPECAQCTLVERCRSRLIQEANERGISLTGEEKALVPAKLAHTIFSEIIPGLKP
jgi:hypothetical protein